MSAATIVTVSQLCRYIKSLLEEQKPLADLLVRGEISGLSYRSSSGHLYFNLSDGDSSIRCVMFSRYAEKMASLPEDGSLVVVRGTANLYERDSSFQLLAYDLQELGTGTQQNTLDMLKKKLYAEGLFSAERKRPFPAYPKAVAVITSPDGAVLHDIITTFRQLNPLVKLIVYPATVQGTTAAASIIAAITEMIRENICDSCVIARGGGSSENLSAFNDEALVRAVAKSPVPVVSAVGHEVDYSLLDLVADARAATPTAACRIMATPLSQLAARVEDDKKALTSVLLRKFEATRDRINRLSLMLSSKSPQAELKKNRQTALFLIKSLEDKEKLILERLRHRATNAVDCLELVNPAQLLRRGYSITSSNSKVIINCSQVKCGDIITSQLHDGVVASSVLSIMEDCAE